VNRALRAATIGVLLFTPVVVSACSAGQLNQTSTQERDKTGGSAQVGNLTLREVQLAYPDGGRYAAGDDAELTLAIANGGNTPDQLVSVSGNGFSGFRVSGTGTAVTTGSSSASSSASGTAASSSAASTTGSSPTTSTSTAATTSGSASGAATATGSGVAGATGTPSSATATGSGSSQTVQVPAQSIVLLGQNAPHIFLENLTSSLTTGQTLQLTLTFANAGRVSVQALVADPSDQTPVTSSFNFTQAPDAATTSSAGQG
jgi:copper(I)-binding protein